MRVLKTILATVITWAVAGALVYATLWFPEAVMLVMASIAMWLAIIGPLYHWWEEFDE